MKTMIRPIAVSKTSSIQNKTIGNKKCILNSNIKFASQIISKHSFVGAYDFNFDSFVFLDLSAENAHNVVQAADCVIELFITMNHFNGNPSLQVEYKEYFEELKGQIIYYLNQLQVWSERHYQYFQLLYKQISSRFLGEENQKDRQMFEKQLFQVKSQFINWRETLANKREKGKEPNSLSRPFYQMMYQFMQSKKTLNYKEIWKLSIPSQLRLGIEKQKHQYMKHWNAMDSREQEIIGCLFATHKITSYLPNQILSMKEAEWIQFVEVIKTSAKEWELLLSDFNKYSIEKGMEKYVHTDLLGSSENELLDSKIQFINAVESIDKPEELQAVIHLFFQNSNRKEDIEFFQQVVKKQLETSQFQMLQSEAIRLKEITESEDIVTKKQNLKELIYQMNREKWDSLFCEMINYSQSVKEKLFHTPYLCSVADTSAICMFENVKEKRFHTDLLGSSVSDVVGDFFERIELLSEEYKVSLRGQPEEIQTMSYKNQLLESIAITKKPEELQGMVYLLMENNLLKKEAEKFGVFQKAKIEIQKQNLTEFISYMDLKNWETLLNEIDKSRMQSQDSQGVNFHTDLTKNKTQFLDFMETIESAEELQNIVHLLLQDEHLKNQAQSFHLLEMGQNEWKRRITGDEEYEYREVDLAELNHESLILYKQNFKKLIRDMDLKNWETLLNKIEQNRMQSQNSYGIDFHTDLTKNKTQFLDFLETIESAEELQNIVQILLQDEHLKNQAQSCHLLEMGQNEWKRRITGDKEYEYREVDLAELNHESLILYKQNLKKIIQKMDLKNWETLLNNIDKNRMQSQDSQGVNFFTDLLGSSVKAYESQNSRLHRVKYQITEDKEYEYREVDLAELNHESLILYKQNLKKIIQKMDLKNWETLHHEISTKENHLHTDLFDQYIGQFSHMQEGRYERTEAAGDRAKFLDFLEAMDSTQEIQKAVGYLLQNEYLKGQVQRFNLMEIVQSEAPQIERSDIETGYKELKLLELSQGNLILQKDKLKVDFFQPYMLETFFEQIEMFSEENRDNSEQQTKGLRNSIAKAKFLISVEVMESQEELQTLVHFVMGNPNMKKVAERFGVLKNGSVKAESNQENLMAKKQKLKSFISDLDSEKWEVIYGELRGFEENIVQTQGLSGVIKDYFSRIELFNGKFKDALSSQTEEIKMLSYKTQFLESIGSVEKLEELQSLIHFMTQDTQLEKRTEAFKLSLSEEIEKIGYQEDFIVQKYNLKEWVGYMDSTKWINLYHRMENYNHDTINKKGKAEEPILSTNLFKQYHMQVYHMQGYKNILKQLQQLTEQEDKTDTKKIVTMEKFLEMRRRSEISLYMKSSFDELQEEHSFLTFYQPTQLVATQPVSGYNRRSSNIVPENMTGDIRRIETTMQERVEDIGRIVKQNHSVETTADFSRQLESIVDKMELYHKEMEQIKSCQSKLLQSTNSNQIVNKVMKQLQGQLKLERMRRGLDR